MERLLHTDRRIVLAVVGLVSVLLVGVAVWFFLLRGDANGNGGDASMENELVSSPGSEGTDGTGLLSLEEMIAQSVAATIEAVPTATPEPTPTPDVAATLQAQLAFNREQAPPVIELNPLDLEGNRDPHLTPAELEYFRQLGPRIWVHTVVWVWVRELLAVDIAEWDPETMQLSLAEIDALLDSAPERPGFSGMNEVSPLVRAYADSIEAGMTGVSRARGRLAESLEILQEPVGHPEREKLLRLSREVEDLLGEFDDAMSAYGCSVCGELFRRVGG